MTRHIMMHGLFGTSYPMLASVSMIHQEGDKHHGFLGCLWCCIIFWMVCTELPCLHFISYLIESLKLKLFWVRRLFNVRRRGVPWYRDNISHRDKTACPLRQRVFKSFLHRLPPCGPQSLTYESPRRGRSFDGRMLPMRSQPVPPGRIPKIPQEESHLRIIPRLHQ